MSNDNSLIDQLVHKRFSSQSWQDTYRGMLTEDLNTVIILFAKWIIDEGIYYENQFWCHDGDNDLNSSMLYNRFINANQKKQ